MSKLPHALALIENGHRVAWVQPGVKAPPMENFPDKATRNPEEIKAWWAGDQGGRNIAIVPADDEVAIDLDVKKGGPENWAKLTAKFQAPATRTTITPTRGKHLFFRGLPHAVPNAVDAFAALLESAGVILPRGKNGKPITGIDVRGPRGYVLGPGSTLPAVGAYRLERMAPGSDKVAPIAQAPEWLIEACGVAVPKTSAPVQIGHIDQSRACESVVDWFRTAPPAIQGQGGDRATHLVMKRAADYGLAEDECFALALEHYNPRCSPPWNPDDLRAKVQGGYRYREEPVGSKSPESVAAIFEDAELAALPGYEKAKDLIAQARAQGIRVTANGNTLRLAYSYEEADAETDARIKAIVTEIGPAASSVTWERKNAETAGKAPGIGYGDISMTPPAACVVAGFLPRASTVLFYGPPGEIKTGVMLDMGHAIASPKRADWFDRKVKHGLVVYIPLEGLGGIRKRLLALQRHYGDRDAGVALHVLPELDCDPTTESGRQKLETTLQNVCALYPGLPFQAVIFDTVSQLFGRASRNENEAKDVAPALAQMTKLAESTGAAVVLVHHAGKDPSKGGRGSSAFKGNVDCEISVERVQEGRPVRAISAGKMRDLEPFPEFHVEPHPIVLGFDEEGEVYGSFIVVRGHVEPSAERLSRRAATLMQALRAIETGPKEALGLKYQALTGCSDSAKRSALADELPGLIQRELVMVEQGDYRLGAIARRA